MSNVNPENSKPSPDIQPLSASQILASNIAHRLTVVRLDMQQKVVDLTITPIRLEEGRHMRMIVTSWNCILCMEVAGTEVDFRHMADIGPGPEGTFGRDATNGLELSAKHMGPNLVTGFNINTIERKAA